MVQSAARRSMDILGTAPAHSLRIPNLSRLIERTAFEVDDAKALSQRLLPDGVGVRKLPSPSAIVCKFGGRGLDRRDHKVLRAQDMGLGGGGCRSRSRSFLDFDFDNLLDDLDLGLLGRRRGDGWDVPGVFFSLGRGEDRGLRRLRGLGSDLGRVVGAGSGLIEVGDILVGVGASRASQILDREAIQMQVLTWQWPGGMEWH